MNDQYFMKEALKEAKKAFAKAEVPVGVVIVKDEDIIARAHNLKESRKDPLAHAELLAIRKASQHLASWRLSDCTLYVTLEPCSMCAGAIVQARLKEVIFATADPKTGSCGSIYNLVQEERFNHTVKLKSGVLANQAQDLLKDFFKQLRNR